MWQAVRSFYNNHEGVHLFSWKPKDHGFGVMDRYLDGIFRGTHLAAALSHCTVMLFNPKSHTAFFADGQRLEVFVWALGLCPAGPIFLCTLSAPPSYPLCSP